MRRWWANVNTNRACTGNWSITDDGSLYTMPIGSTELRMGRVER